MSELDIKGFVERVKQATAAMAADFTPADNSWPAVAFFGKLDGTFDVTKIADDLMFNASGQFKALAYLMERLQANPDYRMFALLSEAWTVPMDQVPKEKRSEAIKLILTHGVQAHPLSQEKLTLVVISAARQTGYSATVTRGEDGVKTLGEWTEYVPVPGRDHQNPLLEPIALHFTKFS